jgi:hypothetical protein
MTGEYNGASAEEELNKIRAIEDWRITEATSLQLSLASLDGALKALVESNAAWQGESGDAARAHVTDMRKKFTKIEGLVDTIVKAIEAANTSRRAAVSGAELPSNTVPQFWVDAVKSGGTVNYPGLGTLPAATALTTIANHLSGQRDQQAQTTVESVRTAMVDPTQKIAAARAELAGDQQAPPPQSGSGGPGGMPGGGAYPGPGGGTGGYPGGGSFSGGGTGGGLIGGPDFPGGIYPGGPGGTWPHPVDRPTIDDPHLVGHVPGGGVGGPGHGTVPGGAGGSMPGGLLGAIGGGGAAALAFGARANLSSLGNPGLSALKSGGLLGGGTGGAGGPGASQPGATGMGSRSGGGMVGGQGSGASEEEKQRRSGSNGPIAEHLEDDEEPIARAKGARAGSRDDLPAE